jgi:protein-disulfide isomerase
LLNNPNGYAIVNFLTKKDVTVKLSHLIPSLTLTFLVALPCFATEAAATKTITTTNVTAPSTLSTEQTKQVEGVVHHYLVENPEVLVESFKTLKNREMDKRQQNTDNATNAHAKEIFNSPASPVLGNQAGDVTIVEFLDYRCPHCQTMGTVLDNLIKSDPKLRVVIKELPIFGKESQYAAKAALAAANQGKFPQLHAALLGNHGSLDEAKVKELAGAAGINIKKLETDLQNPGLDKQLSRNTALAQALQIEGTPAFVIKNRMGGKALFIPGAASQENLQEMIGRLRSGIRS